MTHLPKHARQALQPLENALLAHARADAAAAMSNGRQRAEEIRATARQRASDLADSARNEGRQQAQAEVDTELARKRRQAHALVLAAQRAVYEQLRRRCLDTASALRDDPGYSLLRSQLAGIAAVMLGPSADIQDGPGGGVVASSDGRSVDLSLAALVERELAGRDTEVPELWSD